MTNQSNEYDIENKTAYRAAVRTLNTQGRPPAILRFIMRALESYRQSRKMGWSRPWNKYGIMTFQSFKLDFTRDDNQTELSLIDAARAVLDADCLQEAPKEAVVFIDDLLSSENRDQLMGFVFVHEFTEDGQRYEGATLSFGRVKDKRFRDRLDLIVEAPLGESGAGNFSRLRIFVDPFRTEKPPLWSHVAASGFESDSPANALFKQLSDLSWDWAGEDARHWDHWTSAYIEYFGPRQWLAQNSHFFDEEGQRSPQRAQA